MAFVDPSQGAVQLRIDSTGALFARSNSVAEFALSGATGTASIPDALIPVAVDDLAAVVNGVTPTTEVDVSWTYTPVAYIANFKLYRKTGLGGTYALIASPASGDVIYLDTGLTTGTEYYYRLDAYNPYFTTPSNEANVTTD